LDPAGVSEDFILFVEMLCKIFKCSVSRKICHQIQWG